ncbi:MucBP domain-containing protein, partial [Enterococcus haemoperoxidus]
ITYIYEKKKAQGQVKIHYKDENGNTILPDEELTGVEGSEYTVAKLPRAGENKNALLMIIGMSLVLVTINIYFHIKNINFGGKK